MKNYTIKLFFAIVIALLGFVPKGLSQFSIEKLDLDDPDQEHVVVLKSGKRIKGSILSIKNTDVEIRSNKGDSTLQLTLSEIKRIRVKDDLFSLSKKFDSKLPPTLSLFFTNTAFAMKKSERSYRTFWGNSLFYSKQVAKNIEWGLGYSFPLFINGKVKFTNKVENKDRRHGIQLAFAIAPIGDPVGILEIAQVNTWGDEDKFINFAINYYEIQQSNFFFGPFGESFFPDRYFSIALGGGFRLGENVQLHLNKNVNFNQHFINANLIPSFGINWIRGKHMVGFGYMSSNDLGFNYFPVFETNFDEFAVFTKLELAKLPFLSYSRIF